MAPDNFKEVAMLKLYELEFKLKALLKRLDEEEYSEELDSLSKDIRKTIDDLLSVEDIVGYLLDNGYIE